MATVATTPNLKEPSADRADPLTIALLALIPLAFLALFYRTVVLQHRLAWNAIDDWGHTYIIPFLAGYLVYQQRHRLAAVPKQVYWPGLIPILLGIVAYLFALAVARVHMAAFLAGILTLFGICLLVLGPAAIRVLFLPIAYLAFAVTVAERIMLLITFKLQLIASKGSWILLNIIGKPFGWFEAEVSGNTLTLLTSTGESIPLNVAEACSGMRMVVAFIALAGLVAIVTTKQWWQRILLLLLAAPVAILMNIVRVVVLGLLSIYDPELAAGDAHTLIGTLLLVPALFLYLAIAWALKKIVPEDQPAQTPDAQTPPPASININAILPRHIGRRNLALFTVLATIGVSAIGLTTTLNSLNIKLQKQPIYPENNRQLASLPRETPTWMQLGSDRIESAEIVDELGTENYLNRRFIQKNPEDPQRPVVLDLHAAYYTGMIDTVPHVPERCFVGAGISQSAAAVVLPLTSMDASSWLPDRSVPAELAGQADAIYTVRLASNTDYTDRPGARIRLPRGITPDTPPGLRISTFDINGEGGGLYAGYFFIANGGTVSSAEGVRGLAFDLAAEYAYYLKIQIGSSTVQSPEALAEYSGQLLGELFGEIMRCTPDWIEVQNGNYPVDNPEDQAPDA